MEPYGHGLPLIEDNENRRVHARKASCHNADPIARTQLQAVLEFALKDCTRTISLSASDSSDPIKVILTARQKWSTCPDRPLTTCTQFTPLDFCMEGRPWTGGWVGHYLRMRSVTEASKTLLGDPLASMRHHFTQPDRDDWQKQLGFITIPSQASGQSYEVTHYLTRSELRSRHDDQEPLPGEEYELVLDCEGARAFTIEWWNWGGLEDDLKGKKFINWVDPRLNGIEDRTPPGDPYVLSYAAWEDLEDDEGNDMVRLEVEQNKTPVKVRFVE